MTLHFQARGQIWYFDPPGDPFGPGPSKPEVGHISLVFRARGSKFGILDPQVTLFGLTLPNRKWGICPFFKARNFGPLVDPFGPSPSKPEVGHIYLDFRARGSKFGILIHQ